MVSRWGPDSRFRVGKPFTLAEPTALGHNRGVGSANVKRALCSFAAVGTPQFVEAYARSKIDGWRAKVEKLAVIAQTQPQSAYCALTHALRSEWSFLCRCLDLPSSWLEPVELAVRNRLIPALTSRSPPNDSLRGVLAQPCRLGGLSIVDATTLCQQHQSSVLITSGLVNLIKNKEQHLGDELHLLRNRRNSIRQTTRE